MSEFRRWGSAGDSSRSGSSHQRFDFGPLGVAEVALDTVFQTAGSRGVPQGGFGCGQFRSRQGEDQAAGERISSADTVDDVADLVRLVLAQVLEPVS